MITNYFSCIYVCVNDARFCSDPRCKYNEMAESDYEYSRMGYFCTNHVGLRIFCTNRVCSSLNFVSSFVGPGMFIS